MNFGGGSSSTQPVQTTTTTKDPWSGAQPYLSQMYGTAQAMQQGGIGYQPYTGQTVASTNPYINTGNEAIGNWGLNNLGGTPGVNAATNYGTSLINQGGQLGGQGGTQDTIGKLESLASQQATEPLNIYRNIINNTPEQANDIRAVINQAGAGNPYLQQILNAQNRQIGDRVNASMSGSGRYGSGAHTDVMTRALAEAEAPLLAQQFEAGQNRILQGTSQLGQVFGQQGQVANQMGGLLGQRAQMYGAQNDLASQAAQRAGQWAQMMPTLDQAHLAPASAALGAGEYQRSIEQQNLDAARNLYTAQQAYPWEQLNREAGILSGAGQLGGTTVANVAQAQAPLLNRLLGGGLAGAGIGSAFGPVGAGIGAAGGGLLGLLNYR